MLKVCITGEAGAGKSHICSLLREEFGLTVLDSDSITRELMEPGGVVYNNVVESFGSDYLLEDGSINRAKLAELVFNDEEKLMLLNSLTHPATIDKLNELCSECYANGEELVIIESAIALDSGYDSFCDEFWYVSSDFETRRSRLLERGYTDEKISSITHSQRDKEFFLSNCDVVIDNSDGKAREQLLDELKEIIADRLSG